jgi:hypothetical protein
MKQIVGHNVSADGVCVCVYYPLDFKELIALERLPITKNVTLVMKGGNVFGEYRTS